MHNGFSATILKITSNCMGCGWLSGCFIFYDFYSLMKYIQEICILALFVGFSINMHAQSKNWGFNVGIGKYELINAGVIYKLSPQNEINASVGYNFMLTNNKSYSTKIEYRYLFKAKNVVFKNSYIGAKTIYWELEDKYFNWEVCSGSVFLGKKIPINRKSGIAIDFGFITSLHLDHTRLNLEEVGWPRMFNYSLNFSYFYYF